MGTTPCQMICPPQAQISHEPQTLYPPTARDFRISQKSICSINKLNSNRSARSHYGVSLEGSTQSLNLSSLNPITKHKNRLSSLYKAYQKLNQKLAPDASLLRRPGQLDSILNKEDTARKPRKTKSKKVSQRDVEEVMLRIFDKKISPELLKKYFPEIFQTRKNKDNHENNDTWYRLDSKTYFRGKLRDDGTPLTIGIYVLENANVYKGQAADSKPHGFGTLLTQQSVYIGRFREGHAEGQGIWQDKAGTMLKGTWKAGRILSGKMIREDTIYEGEFKNGVPQGQGLFKRREVQYRGSFKAGKFDGKGVYITQKIVYQGNFKDGKKHGSGKIWELQRLDDQGYDQYIQIQGIWDNDILVEYLESQGSESQVVQENQEQHSLLQFDSANVIQ